MTRSFPANDPFPPQATSRLPGDPVSLGALETSALTLMRPAIERTVALVERYVGQYSSSKATGQFGALIGEHGSGKTHTVLYVASEIAKAWPPGTDDRNPFQVTVKVETADIGVFYRALFAQIKQEVLKSLMERARDQIAIDEFKSAPDVADDEAERLRDNRIAAERLLTDYLVDRGTVSKRQVDEIGRVGEGRSDFQRALPFLLGNDLMLSTYAYRWMAGETVEENGLRAIGVSGLLQSVEMFKSALEILAALFGRARRPFLLYVDQFEKLVNESASQREENVSVLRRLIDVLPSERGLLLIAGTADGWQALPQDVRERFGQNEIELPILTKHEAASLITIFLDGGKTTNGESDLFPFTQGAIEALARFGRGNIRRFLQSCSTMYQLAREKTQQIDVLLVEGAIRSDQLRPPADEREVAQTIERLLDGSGLRWRRHVHIYRQIVDYAIVLPDDRPRVAIEVTRAVYKDDETRRADALVRLAEDLRNVGTQQSCVIAVVIGYSTREVSTVIGSAVRQIFYDSRTFAEDFRAALAATEEPSRIVPSSEPPAQFSDELRVLRAELKQMQEQRDSEVEVLQQRLRELLARSEAVNPPPAGDALRERWQAERGRIESEIGKSRNDRRTNEFQRVQRAAKTIEREWRERHIRLLVGVALLIGLAAITWIAGWWIINDVYLLRFLVSAAGGVSVASLLFGIVSYFRILQPADLRFLTRPVESLDDLEQARIRDPNRAERLLFHRHPQVRFVAARSAKSFSNHMIAEWLESEPLPLVRRAQAQALARSVSTRNDVVDIDLVSARVPEAAYVAAALPLGPVIRDKRLTIANAIGNKALPAYFGAYGDARMLLQSFEAAGVGREAVVKMQRSIVKDALRTLSPFDEDGLGCFEDLPNIQLVDDVYLFWSEVLFMLERSTPT